MFTSFCFQLYKERKWQENFLSPVKFMFEGPALWLNRLSLHLQCWHLIWVPIQVSAASFLFQLVAYDLGMQQKMTQFLGPCTHMGDPGSSWLWHIWPLQTFGEWTGTWTWFFCSQTWIFQMLVAKQGNECAFVSALLPAFRMAWHSPPLGSL